MPPTSTSRREVSFSPGLSVKVRNTLGKSPVQQTSQSAASLFTEFLCYFYALHPVLIIGLLTFFFSKKHLSKNWRVISVM
jgi:hypothetical protein